MTCVVGMVSQEMSLTSPVLRDSCSRILGDWTSYVVELLEEAKAVRAPAVEFDSEEVGWYLNALWQGSMLVAKAREDPQIIVRNLARARAQIDALFGHEPAHQTKANRSAP